ncbi:MAG: ABC transporter permease [Oligoflexia bacterium]|nr:ABC transporter permease [Oligoflexia bacterium]
MKSLRAFEYIFSEIGAALLFIRDIIRIGIKNPCDRKTLLEQIYQVTTQSLLTTATSGFFVGALLTVQFNMQLKTFSALSVLGGLSTSGTVRELGPLLIAFMLSGKVGAYTSAELGTMRVTEQIDAMKCLGTNPLQYLILPRLIGIVISSFFLLLFALLMSVLGGIVMAKLVAHMSFYEYISSIPLYVTGTSILGGLFKCFMFSVLLAIICTYKGYTTTGGAKGVGRTVLATALSTMVGINLMDWFTSYIGRALSTILGV